MINDPLTNLVFNRPVGCLTLLTGGKLALCAASGDNRYSTQKNSRADTAKTNPIPTTDVPAVVHCCHIEKK